jgi:hypothetical protein
MHENFFGVHLSGIGGKNLFPQSKGKRRGKDVHCSLVSPPNKGKMDNNCQGGDKCRVNSEAPGGGDQ